jgi:hypothetical protein
MGTRRGASRCAGREEAREVLVRPVEPVNKVPSSPWRSPTDAAFTSEPGHGPLHSTVFAHASALTSSTRSILTSTASSRNPAAAGVRDRSTLSGQPPRLADCALKWTWLYHIRETTNPLIPSRVPCFAHLALPLFAATMHNGRPANPLLRPPREQRQPRRDGGFDGNRVRRYPDVCSGFKKRVSCAVSCGGRDARENVPDAVLRRGAEQGGPEVGRENFSAVAGTSRLLKGTSVTFLVLASLFSFLGSGILSVRLVHVKCPQPRFALRRPREAASGR